MTALDVPQPVGMKHGNATMFELLLQEASNVSAGAKKWHIAPLMFMDSITRDMRLSLDRRCFRHRELDLRRPTKAKGHWPRNGLVQHRRSKSGRREVKYEDAYAAFIVIICRLISFLATQSEFCGPCVVNSS